MVRRARAARQAGDLAGLTDEAGTAAHRARNRRAALRLGPGRARRPRHLDRPRPRATRPRPAAAGLSRLHDPVLRPDHRRLALHLDRPHQRPGTTLHRPTRRRRHRLAQRRRRPTTPLVLHRHQNRLLHLASRNLTRWRGHPALRRTHARHPRRPRLTARRSDDMSHSPIAVRLDVTADVWRAGRAFVSPRRWLWSGSGTCRKGTAGAGGPTDR